MTAGGSKCCFNLHPEVQSQGNLSKTTLAILFSNQSDISVWQQWQAAQHLVLAVV